MFTLLSISDSDKHFAGAVHEYEKRLGKIVKIENLKPFKGNNQNFVIEKETDMLIAIVQKKYPNAQKILLIKEGKAYDTMTLAKLLTGKELVFMIGGPYGVDEKKLKSAFPDLLEVSFGAITLPHGLAKLTLLEQMYRCSTIWNGKKYHY